MTQLQPGQMLGPYRIISQIGEGGMATVYKAYQPSMDRNVALKVLPGHLASNKEFAARFQQESRIIGSLEHPHILPVFDSGESDGVSYLVMRYLEAGTLKEKMEARPLTLDEIDRIFLQLADALSYAHERGVIHRDLKPSNALIDSRGNLFLTDFGIAKLLESTSHFTKTDAIMGTPAYISPEQAQAHPVDHRTDIYSLGIILYEMVTGRVPFMADTPLAVLFKHVTDNLPLPSVVKPGINPLIEQIILKALAKDPKDRFSTVADFAAAWRRARSAESSTQVMSANDDRTMRYEDLKKSQTRVEKIEAAPHPQPSKKRSSTLAIGCLALFCLLVGGGGAVWFVTNRTGLSIINGGASDQEFAIEIGDEISNGEPGPGSGVIEEPGSRDIFTFSAEAGDEVFIQINDEPESAGNINFILSDDLGSNILSTCLGCGNPGTIALERGGQYTLTVGNESSENAGSGEYAFTLWEVPSAEEFSIGLDEEISNDLPGPGAGFIESPGAQDVYTFEAEEGQSVFFQVTVQPQTSDLINWMLQDGSENVLFETCLQCGTPGTIVLEQGGTYTITVGGGAEVGTGAYAFKVLTVPLPEVFEIKLDDYIFPGFPGEGAGVIESPGAQDVYTIAATAGQSINFSVFATPSVGDSIPWRLIDENGNEFFNTCLDCGDPAPVTFETDGTYSLIVGGGASAATGEYEFFITLTRTDFQEFPTLQNGDEGPNVLALQYLLRNRGQDVEANGIFDETTEAAVINFQTEYGLNELGTVEGETWRALTAVLHLEKGDEGDAVFAAQVLLKEKFGFTDLVIDGTFGDITEAAVLKFQTENSIFRSGTVDPVETWPALISLGN